MPTLQFQDNNSILWAELSFEESRIQGLSQPYPYLNINVSLRKRIVNKEGQLLQIGGTLFLPHGGQEPAIADVRLNALGTSLEDTGFSLEIPILHHQIKCVEDAREDRSPSFRLKAWALVGVNSGSAIHTFAVLKGQTDFTIPKDSWVERLLPAMGYGTFRLVCIPFPPFAEAREFREKVITEIERAQIEFLSGNYDNVISQCRNALQALVSFVQLDLKGKPASYPNRAEAFCDQVLRPSVGKLKADLAYSLLIAPWRLFSAPGKPGRKRFSRQDAELAFHLTTSVLSYVSNVVSTQEANSSN